MLGIGLQVKAGDVLAVFRSRSLMIRSFLANFLITPLFGLLLVRFIPMETEVAASFLLLACAPGGLSAVQLRCVCSS